MQSAAGAELGRTDEASETCSLPPGRRQAARGAGGTAPSHDGRRPLRASGLRVWTQEARLRSRMPRTLPGGDRCMQAGSRPTAALPRPRAGPASSRDQACGLGSRYTAGARPQDGLSLPKPGAAADTPLAPSEYLLGLQAAGLVCANDWAWRWQRRGKRGRGAGMPCWSWRWGADAKATNRRHAPGTPDNCDHATGTVCLPVWGALPRGSLGCPGG